MPVSANGPVRLASAGRAAANSRKKDHGWDSETTLTLKQVQGDQDDQGDTTGMTKEKDKRVRALPGRAG